MSARDPGESLKTVLSQTAREWAKTEEILAAIGDPVSIQDPNFRVLYQNPAHRDLMGDQTGRFCYEAYENQTQVCDGCPVAMCFADGKVHRVTRRVDRGDVAGSIEITASPLRDTGGRIAAGIKVVRDVTAVFQAAETLHRKLNIEREVSAISARFAGVADLDENINVALERHGILSGATRASVALLGEDGKELVVTHEWCAPGEKPQIGRADDLSGGRFGWLVSQIRNAPVVHIDDVSRLPPEAAAERAFFEDRGARSCVLFRLGAGGKTTGFAGFDNLPPYAGGQGSNLSILGVTAEIIGNALERHHIQNLLAESGDLLQKILAGLDVAVLIVDPATTVILDCNATSSGIFGYTREEMIGRETRLLHLDESRDQKFNRERAERLAEQESFRTELHLKRKNGEIVPCEILVRQILTSDKKPKVVSLIRDISGRVKAAEELEERMRMVALSAEIGMILTQGSDLQMILSHCAEAVVRHTGVALARIWTLREGEQLLELRVTAGGHAPADGNQARVPVGGTSTIGRIAASRQPHLIREEIGSSEIEDKDWVRREGLAAFAGYPLVVADRLHGVLALFSGEPLRETTFTALVSVADTIALGIEHEESTEQLRQARAEWEEVFDSLTDMVTIHDRDFNIIRANKAAKNILGLPLSRGKTAKCHAFYHGMDHPPETCPSCQTLRTGQAATAEYYEPHLKRQIEVKALPRFDKESRVSGVIHVVRDITDQRAARLEQESLQSQLFQSQKMESLGRIAGGVAHDFNNILTAIIMYSELALLKHPEDKPLREQLTVIYESAQKAAALTQQLLAFSRKQVLEVKAVNLSTIIGDAAKMLGRVLGEDIALEIRAESHRLILADPGQIEQVLMNLVVNARDALPNGGRIEIETADLEVLEESPDHRRGTPPGPCVRLLVRDNGIGMSPQVRERIFEPFFTTKEQGKGTGLGLAMVYGIVKQHSGHVFVESEPGRGTTFTVFFPFTANHTATDRSAPETMPGGTETILVVDDEADIRLVLGDVLKELGYRVLEAAGADEASRISRDHAGTIDLLLTDVIMPGMNGKQLAAILTRERPGMKVIFMSGYTDDIISRHGVLDPGINLLNKPLLPLTLAKKVRVVLAARQD